MHVDLIPAPGSRAVDAKTFKILEDAKLPGQKLYRISTTSSNRFLRPDFDIKTAK